MCVSGRERKLWNLVRTLVIYLGDRRGGSSPGEGPCLLSTPHPQSQTFAQDRELGIPASACRELRTGIEIFVTGAKQLSLSLFLSSLSFYPPPSSSSFPSPLPFPARAALLLPASSMTHAAGVTILDESQNGS